ncbi:MAG TPA: GNAT family N-acetyltransferase [Patescibacteria group bacterium]|nr:GNAT family N-acetyltransferase [Patescibacteria group bacterium]
MIIRLAVRKDLTAIAQTHLQSYQWVYQGIMPQSYLAAQTCEKLSCSWEKRLFGPGNREFMYVAENDKGNIVGFIAASIDQTHDCFAREVTALYLCREFQGRKIGRSLFQTVLHRFIAQKVGSLIVWVLADNNLARGFYERLGGVVVDKRIISRGKPLSQLAYGWEEINNAELDTGNNVKC